MDKSHFLRHEQEDIFKFKTGFLAFFFSMFGLIITGMFIPSWPSHEITVVTVLYFIGDGFLIWYTVGAFKNLRTYWDLQGAFGASLIIVFLLVVHISQVIPSSHGVKTKYAATVRQVHMAIEAFHSEYGKYPVYLDEVDGKNEREKVYFEGIENTVEEYDIKMVFDDDHDGFVEVEGEKIKLKVAVWTYYKDQMINSWDK